MDSCMADILWLDDEEKKSGRSEKRQRRFWKSASGGVKKCEGSERCVLPKIKPTFFGKTK